MRLACATLTALALGGLTACGPVAGQMSLASTDIEATRSVAESSGQARSVSAMPPTPGTRTANEIAYKAVFGAVETFKMAQVLTPLNSSDAVDAMYRFVVAREGGGSSAPLAKLSGSEVARLVTRYEPYAALMVLNVLRMTLKGPELHVPSWLERHIISRARSIAPRPDFIGLFPEAMRSYLESVGMPVSFAEVLGGLEALKSDPKVGTLAEFPLDQTVTPGFALDVVKAARKFDRGAGGLQGAPGP